MSEQVQDDLVNQIYGYAAELMRSGKSNQDIVEALKERGLDAESAEVVVRNLHDARAKEKVEQGQKNMGLGALWCIGGLVVTGATYGAASGGGSYVVAWGAVVFGGIQFLHGLIQYTSDRD